MSLSFSAFCSRLGFPLTNERWSWCAVNAERRQALFTVWEDRLEPPSRTLIDFTWLNDPARTELGAREFRRVMARVLNDGFDAYGILCEARDPEAHPRKRKRFDHELLVLAVSDKGGRAVGRVTGTIDGEVLRSGLSPVAAIVAKRSAIEDLDGDPVGSETPEQFTATATFYERDPKVRRRVLARAHGRCEHCDELGFEKPGGDRYLETHHIIALAEQGPDTLANVIALCPSHHREAHYGSDRLALEAAFVRKLVALRGGGLAGARED